MSPGKENDVHRLLDIVVEEVSLVDRAANKRRFLVVKRSDPELACPAPAHAAGRRDDRAPEPHAARPAGAHPAGADLRHRRCGRRRFNCVKAIPDALGPPPDPTVLAAALPALSAKVAKLLRLVPQLSLPLLVVGLIDLLIDALGKAKRELQHLQAQMTQLAGVLDRARDLDDPGLLAIAVGAQANMNHEAANVGKGMASLGRLIGIVNLFVGMVGGPEVPDLRSLSGRPLDEALAPVDAIVEVLKGARAALPVG